MTDEIVTPIPSKRCTKCGVEYPATTEYFPKRSKDVLRTECKKCRCEYQHNHYIEHAEDVCQRARHYYANHSKEVNERSRRYQIEHPEQRQEIQRRYYASHRESELERQKRYYTDHHEKKLERDRRYRTNHPTIIRAASHRRRARKLSAGGTYSIADVRLQIKTQTDKRGRLHCHWCGKTIKDKYHIDHVIPLSRGGSNSPGNLVIACPKCNLSKSNKLLSEWNDRLL